jgi:hypothetical protein
MSGTRLLKWPIADIGVPMATGCRSAAVGVLGLLSAAAAIVAVRAMAGALQTPLEPAVLLTAGATAAVAGVLIRLGWLLPSGTNQAGRLDLAVMAATSFAAAALCSGLCWPRETQAGISLLLRVVIVVEEGGAWLWFLASWKRHVPLPVKRSSDPPVRAIVPRETEAPNPFVVSADVTQQFTRSHAADGAEELSGWLRMPFAPGQRTGSIHIAFCPPLRVAPQLAVQQIEGPEARVKTAQLLPYGARFDLKLAAAAEGPTAVLLQFAARTPPEE